MRKFAGVLFSLMLLFILFVVSFEIVCYDIPGLYEREFVKYDVQGILEYWRGEEIELKEITEVMDETMAYLRGSREDLTVMTRINGEEKEFYNETEKLHMADVRDIFVLCLRLRLVFLAACAVITVFLIRKCGAREAVKLLCTSFIVTSLVFLAVCAVLGVIVFLNFSKAFVVFHGIFFSQGNWMFNPEESRMIDIMPEEFFTDMAAYILIGYLIVIAAALAAAFITRRILSCKERSEKQRPVRTES
ncbi:MAG: TIGR01906 family membrane protein [Eubacterium sp.]|nr:TIGR01906 family membrane protein [Eubacterium sp.]